MLWFVLVFLSGLGRPLGYSDPFMGKTMRRERFLRRFILSGLKKLPSAAALDPRREGVENEAAANHLRAQTGRSQTPAGSR
jgi:hypothetical protein